ncbi:dof zinc finger protein DOF3.6-like [Argentina anserina]|uniref:dof zinc finger protein DOF3.6-like n=1 Tax=Argentina anserina TaxID=57926 RepID=UPI0021762FDB|nr:dof zinc finger protein DOF3.6-like [Potentilla anserina]
MQPAQVRIQVQELQPPNMEAGQVRIQMQEEEPDLENSQMLLELGSNTDMLTSTDRAVRECIDMIEQLQASGPPADEVIQQVKARLQALGPLTLDAVQQIRAGFRKLQKLQCPRCESNNTKFSVLKAKRISAPRYHCKNCKDLLQQEIRKPVVLGGVNRKDLLQQRFQRVQRRRMKT